jgi:hypothetical protein
MPYEVRKKTNQDCWEVRNKITKAVRATCTTKDKAMKQIRLLHMLDNKKK